MNKEELALRSPSFRWLYKKTGRLRGRLRRNLVTGHFFNKLTSDSCWWCKINFPPKRDNIKEKNGL